MSPGHGQLVSITEHPLIYFIINIRQKLAVIQCSSCLSQNTIVSARQGGTIICYEVPDEILITTRNGLVINLYTYMLFDITITFVTLYSHPVLHICRGLILRVGHKQQWSELPHPCQQDQPADLLLVW